VVLVFLSLCTLLLVNFLSRQFGLFQGFLHDFIGGFNGEWIVVLGKTDDVYFIKLIGLCALRL
jgi:hypothetical protein